MRIALVLFSFVSILLQGFSLLAQQEEEEQQSEKVEQLVQSSCTIEMEFTGAIGISAVDLFDRAQAEAVKKGCTSILALINTPGGSLQSTRLIVEDILASPIPVLCFVYPQGAHAGSAGAIILQACHVNGALPTTNIGAATPVLGQGQDMPEDLRKKVINDTVSWLEGIAKLRGRNLEFVRDIVTEAKAVDAETAAEVGAIDVVAQSKEEFLAFANGQTVKLAGGVEAKTVTGKLTEYTKDLRFKILDLVGDPQFAYLLLMGSLALLYFEITNPGTIVPGVLGGLGLVLSLITLHKLDVWWGGVTLMALGVALMAAEAFVTSFGILGIGGMVAFAVGSLFLFDLEATGYSLPLTLVLPMTIVLGAIFLTFGYLAVRSMRKPNHSGKEILVGRKGRVISISPENRKDGQIEVYGEIWRFKSRDDLKIGDHAVVEKVEGLSVYVRAANENEMNIYG